jgi:hypothetical protein
MKIITAFIALVPAIAWAGPFDGTWVTDVKTVTVTGTPDSYLLADGMFTCNLCYPGLKIKADGTDQKVTGHAYYDTASAKVLDAHRVSMTTHDAGKLISERTFTVASDGKTMTEEFVSYEGVKPTKGKLEYNRVADAPAGAHSLSGSWQQQGAASSFSSDLLTVTYEETPNGLKMSTPTGQSYDAKFDGKEVLTAGDIGKTMVSLKRINSRTIQETDSRDGKVTDVTVSKVSADGKSMTVVDDDKIHGTKSTFTANKKAT